ncbi:tetraspanin-7 [Elysia marginata]|uniref:Tetraspanin-7 n=1 Tax=Elysia marginata TaxID=1093978 RepID=A0AAV4G3Q6_9GAST|nr:tetraspanin-7 [Elysia marginata]
MLFIWLTLLSSKKIVRGGHRTGKVARHVGCYKNTWYLSIPEDEMENALEVDLSRDRVLCEVKYGGLVIFNNMVPHRGLENTSNSIRWSLDLRYMAPSEHGGWYGKSGVLMRSAGQTLPEINWDGFLLQNEEDKKVTQNKYLKSIALFSERTARGTGYVGANLYFTLLRALADHELQQACAEIL